MKQLNYRVLSLFIAIALLIIAGNSNVNTPASSNAIIYLPQASEQSNLELFSVENQLLNKIDKSLDSIQTTAFEPNWIEKTPLSSPSARKHSAMVYDSLNDKTIIFGGSDGSNMGDTWAYDYSTNTWENMNPALSPLAMNGHAMVYDSGSHKVVLFGSGQTWTYDYSINTWKQQFPQVSPSSRNYHSMVFDTIRQKILMIGGTSLTFETWEMNSVSYNWTNLNPITPFPRLLAMAASFDQANDKIIVFGGQNMTSAVYNQGTTFVFDYTTNEWTLLLPAVSPSDRRFYGRPMGYDNLSQKSVFFGGYTNSGTSDELWSFDYSTTLWELVSTSASPSARWIHTMVFSSNSNNFIMFGGTGVELFDQTFELTISDSDPPIIVGPGDLEINYFYSNKNITWILEDLTPANYIVTRNGTSIVDGNWENGDNIVIDLDTLQIGHYIFEITVTDTFGNVASDTVLVTIFDPGIPSVLGPADKYFVQGDINQRITWYISDNNPTFYILEVNLQLITNSTWVGLPFIEIPLQNYMSGYYNFTITLFDDSNNMISDTVFVQIFSSNPQTNSLTLTTSSPPRIVPQNILFGAISAISVLSIFMIIRRVRGP